MPKRLTLSVHELVDFLLRSGSIDSRVFNLTAMNEGTRLHAYLQAKSKASGENYLAEFPFEETFAVNDYLITLNGRADGVVKTLSGEYFIDEIKSTVIDLNVYHEQNAAWHLGQAKCYALMLAHLYELEQVGVQLSYISQVDNSRMNKRYNFSRQELENDIDHLLRQYLNFYNVVEVHISKRNESAETMYFPFESFRVGQKKLAEYTYAMSKQGGNLYVEAPTGIGKTISTLYPATHAFSDGNIDKIFYLTAKTSGQNSAYQAIQILRTGGLIVKPIVITAKDKICLKLGAACNPDECPFAENYYNKLSSVLYEILVNEDNLDFETIVHYGNTHTICPFELQLDLATYSDVIIGDYNYLFDPLVYLRRFFDEDGSHYFGLIDEAHNLVERTRDMYSITVTEASFAAMKKSLKGLEHKKILQANRKITRHINKFKKDNLEEEPVILSEMPSVILNAFNDFIVAGQDVMRNESEFVHDEFRDFFFAVNRFLKIYDFFDETYVLYFYEDKNGWVIRLFNLDPRFNIKRGLGKVNGSVLFSATLSPTDYFVDLLGGKKESPLLRLPNPFPEENRLVMVAQNIETTYRKRDSSYEEIAKYIEAFVKVKTGNYLIFFPSYKYLESVLMYLEDSASKEQYTLLIQEKAMSTFERNEFLANFEANPKKTIVGLAVLGGVFAEGIDLPDDRLIGAVIVGVGLPMVNYERDLIKEYYQNQELNGFNYAYTNPGLNRVAQALGRVIRSETDKGAILLIDTRYGRQPYRNFVRSLHSNYQVVSDPTEVSARLSGFWYS